MKKLTNSLLEKLVEGDLIYKYPFASDHIVDEYNPEDIKNISPFTVKSISPEEFLLSKIDPTSMDLYNITLRYSYDQLLNGQFWVNDSFPQDNFS